MTDEEWAFLAPYLALVREDAPQREHPLRELLDGPRYIARSGAPWRMMPRDLPPWHAVYQQARRWLAASCFEAAAHDLRELVRLKEGKAASMRLEVVKLDEAKKGFVLLPRRWVVERSFAWSARFKRLAKDYERLPEVLAGLHALVFCTHMLKALAPWLQGA